MAKIRNISGEDRRLPWLNDRVVPADETVEIPDDHFDAYVCQTDTWESVTEPKSRPNAGPNADGGPEAGTASDTKKSAAAKSGGKATTKEEG